MYISHILKVANKRCLRTRFLCGFNITMLRQRKTACQFVNSTSETPNNLKSFTCKQQRDKLVLQLACNKQTATSGYPLQIFGSALFYYLQLSLRTLFLGSGCSSSISSPGGQMAPVSLNRMNISNPEQRIYVLNLSHSFIRITSSIQ